MTKDAAKSAAQNTANQNGVPILLYCDPIGNAEDFDGPWGYCPTGGPAELLARFRDRSQDEVLTPVKAG